MNREQLTQATSHDRSVELLQEVYDQGLIPPEKKPFLIDLHRSAGPYLAVQDGAIICDGASQIASLGLGFNATPLFGAAQFLETWTNDTGTATALAVRAAYEQLLQRKLGTDAFRARFCASGAEAVELTLAYYFGRRKHKEARRVLAFEGSFHGRMMVALASTWNPAKREPFAWPGYESVFAPFPEMDSDAVHDPTAPTDWQALWTTTEPSSFAATVEQVTAASSTDALLQKEIEALTSVRESLSSGEVFAMLIEPMQCEGGDRYGSARFHQGLAFLSQAFDIPLVYDEIQTGFGLGGEFFWHRMFQLKKTDGSDFYPAGIVCAKKAQTGISICLDAGDKPVIEAISFASLARGYIQASVLDQQENKTLELEATNKAKLKQLVDKYPDHISRGRAKGLCFAFDFADPEIVKQFVGNRFHHGLLYYPAGTKTARFRFNMGYRPEDIKLFWNQLDAALAQTFAGTPANDACEPVGIEVVDTRTNFDFHETLIESKLARMRDGQSLQREQVIEYLQERLTCIRPEETYEIVTVDSSNYPEYRDRMLAMQTRVYEPARQSPPEEFDALFSSDRPVGILVLDGDKIAAMSSAGPLALFKSERGVTEDPYVDDATVYYMLDLTVAEGYRGGFGRAMKRAMLLLAHAEGVTAMHGRNRDRLAARMWMINLSLGSFATKYLVDDYPDTKQYRDCFYYRCSTNWVATEPSTETDASRAAPLAVEHLDKQFVHENLPVLVNKLTLSNFITERFLNQLVDVAKIFPEELRHLYTANGLSECVDKIVKVLWNHRQPKTDLLTIDGHDFGHGSFLSRSLSGVGEAFFCVDRLQTIEAAGVDSFFAQLEQKLSDGDFLGLFVEPLSRRTGQRIDEADLARLVETSRQHNVPVVFNETSSLFHRYSSASFTASGVVEPDAAIAYLGGQMALVAASNRLFLDQPLLLISTWEGDAFSLAQFHQAMTHADAKTTHERD